MPNICFLSSILDRIADIDMATASNMTVPDFGVYGEILSEVCRVAGIAVPELEYN